MKPLYIFMFAVVLLLSPSAEATWCMKDHPKGQIVRYVFWWAWDTCPPNSTPVENAQRQEILK